MRQASVWLNRHFPHEISKNERGGEESNAKKRRDFDDQPKTVGEAQKKIEKDFGRKYSQTDCALIISLLALYKKYNKMHSINNLFDIPFYSENIPDDCDYLKPENQIKKKHQFIRRPN